MTRILALQKLNVSVTSPSNLASLNSALATHGSCHCNVNN